PSNHLELVGIENYRWLQVEDPVGVPGTYRHLLSARVSRLKSTYAFTRRMFVRVIAQYVSTDRDPSLYITTVNARDATLSGSVLVAYKLDWQSVFYVGFGDDQQLSSQETLTRLDRQFFVKLSYAFRR